MSISSVKLSPEALSFIALMKEAILTQQDTGKIRIWIWELYISHI
jgi:hypothetical protein